MGADERRAPAVVLSGNLGKQSDSWSLNAPALALTKSLGRHGVEVFRFHPDEYLFDLKSRYCTHVKCPNLYDQPAALVRQLKEFSEKAGSQPVLFPASDGAAQFIADNEEVLEPYFCFTSPSAECIARTQHKRELIETANEMGVPIPETFFPSSQSEIVEIAGKVSYPLIVKPVYSPDWKRTEVVAVFGRMKALEVDNADDLIRHCKALLELDSVFMIQEIVQGPDENLLTFMGYIGHDGTLLAGCVRKKLRQNPPKFGYVCSTESVNDPEVFQLAVKLLNSLNYRGIGCVEFKRDPVTNIPKLIEINTRAVRSSMLAIGAGVDFPSIAYDDCVTPGHVQPVLEAKVPVLWIHLRDELSAAVRSMRKKELSFSTWAKSMLGKKIVLAEFSLDDPKPGLLVWAQAGKNLISKAFGKK